MYSSKIDHSKISVLDIYNDLISLIYPIIMIAAGAATYKIIIDSTQIAYSGLNTQISNMGTTLTNLLTSTM